MIAAVALIVQGKRNSDREDARRKADADTRADELKEQRRLAVATAWRQSRVDAHIQMLNFARRVYRTLVQAQSHVDALRDMHDEDDGTFSEPIGEQLALLGGVMKLLGTNDEVDSVTSPVLLFCSDPCRDAVVRYQMRLLAFVSINYYAIRNGNGYSQVQGKSFYDRFKDESDYFIGFAERTYPRLARSDLLDN